MKHTIKLFLILLLVILTSCTSQFQDTRPKMETSKKEIEMKLGEETSLEINLKNIENPEFDIVLSKEGIVEIDEELNVKTLKTGTVIVEVDLLNYVVDPIKFTITVVDDIDFEIIGSTTLLVGDSEQYLISLENVFGVEWSTDNEDIIEVNGCNITALKPGTATLNATYKNVSKSLEITVVELPKPDIELVVVGMTTLKVGDVQTYSVNVDENDVTWSTTTPHLIQVDNNKVTALAAGDAVLVVEYMSKQIEIKITISKDEEAPILAYSGKNRIIINWNDVEALLKDVTALDDTDGDLTKEIKIQEGFDPQSYGIQSVTYEVSDKAGNIATLTREVEVIWNNQVSFIGHAGSYYGIMNTEEAILYAIQVLKYQYVEVDLKQTSDGVFVLCHDDTFGDYTLASTPWSVLKDVEITKGRSGGYPSQNGSVTNSPYTSKICSLERFLDICKTNGVRPVIELKSSRGITNSDQSRMQALMDVIESYDMLEQVVFLGSQYNCLIWTRNNGYDMVECQYLVNSCENETYLNRCIQYNLDISINVTGNYSNSDGWLARYKEAGLKISTYTYTQWVNYDVVQTWINKGVDFVTCDWHKMDVLSLPENTGEIGVTHKVVFKDIDGTILKETIVKDGKTAAAPANPTKEGYQFSGWDKELSNILEDTVFTATYEAVVYSITYNSNLEEVVEGSFAEKQTFINELYSDLFDWIKENYASISGMSFANGVYTFTKNGKTVTFGSTEDILAIDIYDFELTLSNLFYKPVERNSDGSCTILEDENYFLNSSKYRIKYQGVDAWLYNAIVKSYNWYDDTYTPTSAGKIQIFFRMHQWAKGTPISVFESLPKKYEVIDSSHKVTLPTDYISYTILDEITLSNPLGDVEFLGWYSNPEYTGSPVEKIEKGTTGNIVLYAKWNLE